MIDLETLYFTDFDALFNLYVMLFAFLFFVGFYIYFAFAWSKIARKKKHPRPWLAWIPFANVALILQLGNFRWGLVFLYLIPVLGWIALWILLIIANWRIYESLKYPGWLALAPIADTPAPGLGSLAYLAIIGVVAWYKKKRK